MADQEQNLKRLGDLVFLTHLGIIKHGIWDTDFKDSYLEICIPYSKIMVSTGTALLFLIFKVCEIPGLKF